MKSILCGYQGLIWKFVGDENDSHQEYEVVNCSSGSLLTVGDVYTHSYSTHPITLPLIISFHVDSRIPLQFYTPTLYLSFISPCLPPPSHLSPHGGGKRGRGLVLTGEEGDVNVGGCIGQELQREVSWTRESNKNFWEKTANQNWIVF